MSHSFETISEVLKCAAHPERLAIMHLLSHARGRKMSVKNIYNSLQLQQSVVSRHLGILKRGGLLSKNGSGNNSMYSLNATNPVTGWMVKCLQNND